MRLFEMTCSRVIEAFIARRSRLTGTIPLSRPHAAIKGRDSFQHLGRTWKDPGRVCKASIKVKWKSTANAIGGHELPAIGGMQMSGYPSFRWLTRLNSKCQRIVA